MGKNDQENTVCFDLEASVKTFASEGNSSLAPSSASINRRKLLKKRSSLFSFDDGSDDGVADDLLKRAITDAGRLASGVVYMQLWVMNEDSTRLVQPAAGYWLDEVFHSCETGSNNNMCPLCRLVDKSRKDYVPPEPLPIGVGLAGALWAAVQQQGEGIVWRDIKSLAADPDQPWNPRLQLLAECNFGMAAAVPFSVLGEEGIIVCLTREIVNMERLQSETNESFLLSAAQLIGSTFVFRGPKKEAEDERREALNACIRRARAKILALRALGFDVAKYTEKQEELSKAEKMKQQKGSFGLLKKKKLDGKKSDYNLSWHPSSDWIPSFLMTHFEILGSFIGTTLKKFKGAGVSPPPTSNYQQAAWTLFGTFITLAMLTNLNIFISSTLGMDHTFALPPFGALLTLTYGLMAAPASQPRNAILGQAMSMTISILISYIEYIPLWARQSLATSLSVSGMVKFGIIHPPAGAVAMIFSTGKFGWMNMIFTLIANLLAIFSATFINNMSNKRQYPNYWGLRGFIDLFTTSEKEK